MKIPQFKTIRYNLNNETGYYEKQPERIPFNKIPFELKVEVTQDKRIKQNGATELIRGRIKNGKYLFFTGLIPTKFNNLFRGDHYEYMKGKKINSLLLFDFSTDNRQLTVYFFNQYWIYPPALETFINVFKQNRGNDVPPLHAQNSFLNKTFNNSKLIKND